MKIPDRIPVPTQGDTSRYEEYKGEAVGNLPEGLEEQEAQRQAKVAFETERRGRALAAAHEYVKGLCDEKGSEVHNRNQNRHVGTLEERVTQELRVARYFLNTGRTDDL